MKTYLLNILIALDQVLTTLVGGYPDETLSSYAHRLYWSGKTFGFMRNVINAIFFWQKDHCLAAFLSERERHHLPPGLRDPH
jgi:ABC-type glycerol-3-phosphate transport system substrate-binding protein